MAVVEDQQLFRALLVRLLSHHPRFHLAGEAADAAAGWEVCTRGEAALVLLDLQLPGGGGLALARRLREARPALRLIALTSLQDNYTIAQVHAIGFHGYVEKDQPLETLELAIEAVAAGRGWFSEFYEHARRRAAADPNDWRKILSDREQEVLALVGALHANDAIAARLGVSQRTVETHRYNIMRKLEIPDAASLIRYAIEQGFAHPGGAHRS